MISKEQIAHDLTMVFLNNRYGVEVEGDFNVFSDSSDQVVTGITGIGSVSTKHFPNDNEPNFTKIKTGEKGLFGFEKTKMVQSGYLSDDIMKSMIVEYYQVYTHFFNLINLL